MDSGRPPGRDIIGGYLQQVGTIEAPIEFDPSQSSVASEETPAVTESAAVDSSAGTGSPASDAEVGAQGNKMNLILGRLANGDRAPLTDLAAELQMPTLEAAVLLTKLSSSGLVVIEGEPGREMVSLTSAGRTVAEIAAS
jgi:hypothetical protein